MKINKAIINNAKMKSKFINDDLRIVCIMDTFSFNVFKFEAIFVQITPSNYKKEIEQFHPNMLIVESAWRGKDGLWENKIQTCSEVLVAVVKYCKEQNIPTVFWNKEDPYHFSDFIKSAKLFDYVFTTDIVCIPLYKRHLQHDNVSLLLFSCQPKIHNPIEQYERKDAFVFAGAYYKRFRKRNKEFSKLLGVLGKISEVDIFDRNYHKDTVFKYPQKYHKYIRGGLDYNDIDRAYKGYRYAINLNSITNSPSMFSRRVLELMASNTIVISNYSIGIDNLLGELVLFGKNQKLLKEKIHLLEEDTLYYKKFRLRALRKVMQEHTAKKRLEDIVLKIFPEKIEIILPYVLCVTYAKQKSDIEILENTFSSQTYEYKYMLIVCSNEIIIDKPRANNIVYISEVDNEYNFSNATSIKYIAGLCVHDYYGENYLMDLMLATQYSDVDIITKTDFFMLEDKKKLSYNEENSAEYVYVTEAMFRSSIIKIEDIDKKDLMSLGKNVDNKVYYQKPILAVDSFNYCKNGLLLGLTFEEKTVVNDLEEINEGAIFDELWIQKELKNIKFNDLSYRLYDKYIKLKKFIKRKLSGR